VKANGGSAGVDGVSLEEVERQGVAPFLEVLAADLKAGKYHPQPVLRVYIPKPDGRQRPLGIPTVRDRIVQQACRIVIEPVFEANFQNQSYGFRPKRSAAQAVRAVDKVLLRGWWVRLQDQMRRMRHLSIREQTECLNQMLRGHYAYYGIAGNIRALQRVHRAVERYWRKMLSSRSWQGEVWWKQFQQIKERFPLLRPKLYLPYSELQAIAAL
jgi:hypothetical protein